VSPCPHGKRPDGRHGRYSGWFSTYGQQTSKNKSAAIEMVKFLTSPEIQRVNATTRGYAPTRPSLIMTLRSSANPFFGT